jgi:hypothetical protein
MGSLKPLRPQIINATIRNSILLLMLLAFISILIPACSCTSLSRGYIRYVYDNVNGPFSFEYPETWDLKEFDPDPRAEGVIFDFGSSSAKGGNLDSGTHAAISSIPQTKNPWYNNAHEYLQYELSLAPQMNEYKSLGSGDITLGGVKGEWAAYSYYYIRSSSVIDFSIPGHWTCRYVVVNYKNRYHLLEQRVNTDFDSYEEFKPGFDHILETFKFLE